MINPAVARAITGLSLALLLLGLLLPPIGGLALLAALPIILLLAGALRPPARWGGWVAVCMIPYVCLATAEAVVNPAARGQSIVVACSAVAAFFAAMLHVRLTGVSLRR